MEHLGSTESRAAVDHSTPWLRTAFQTYLQHEPGGVALDASDSPGHHAAELSACFAEVHVLREDRAALDEARTHSAKLGAEAFRVTQGSLLTPPWADRSFDCISVHDAFVEWDLTAPALPQKLARVHGLLKPGAWFVGISPNGRYLRRRGTNPNGVRSSRFTRLLRNTGFREVRRVFVNPSLDRPRYMIPDERAAVRAFEALNPQGGLGALSRRVMAGLGLRGLLYPAYIWMARA